MSRDQLVMFSGGAGSWATAMRVRERHPQARIRLIFADTMIEDEDTYRFLHEAAALVEGAELEILREGRDVWQVFFDERYLGNSRLDPCSKILKRQLIRKWIEEEYPNPDDCVVSIGIDWSEEHRFTKAIPYWDPYVVEAPLTEPPYLDKDDIHAALESHGVAKQRLYELGFPHANCGGFCVKSGMAHFKLLLQTMPERYAYHEQREQELRDYLDKDVAILRSRAGGVITPITLRQFREQIEADENDLDKDEWGGCGCFTPDSEQLALFDFQTPTETKVNL